MDLGYDVIVTISGMVLVFLILILLMVIISIEGKIFDALGGKKAVKKAEKSKSTSAPNIAVTTTPIQVEAGIPGEVVAVIMAAITAMGGGKYVLRTVRRAPNAWAKAGVNDTTAPF